jgi:hypothetical protein
VFSIEREGTMRGYSKAMREADQERRGGLTKVGVAQLDQHAHRVIRECRAAIVNVVESYAVTTSRFDPRALTAVAVAGLFGDLVSNLATSTGPDIVALINRQLAGAGLQLVPVARN